jgi:hypothetical protein
MAITPSRSGLPSKMPTVLAKTSASIVASGQARRRLRINGVVNRTSPRRRSEMTRMRGRAGSSIGVMKANFTWSALPWEPDKCRTVNRTPFRCSWRPGRQSLWAVRAEPRGWPGIGRSEERPSFDGLCSAMTEYDVELNWRRGAAERQQRGLSWRPVSRTTGMEIFLLPRQLSCPFALLTVQRCRCCRVAGSGHSNGSPIACVGNSCRRHSARCHRRGRALVCIAYDPVPGDRYRRGLVASPRSAPCAVPGAFRMGMPVVFRLGLQRSGEKDRQRD